MSGPDIVVLDTRDATDKASFLSATAHALRFPSYFGDNWDAFEECVRDVGQDAGPMLLVWTGASSLPAQVRDTAISIFEESLADGVDLLIVDDVSAAAEQPDFAVARERVGVPRGGLAQAQQFWQTVGFFVSGTDCEADAISVELVELDDFHPSVGPEISVADLMGLVNRLTAAGYTFTEKPLGIDVSDPHGTLMSFTPY